MTSVFDNLRGTEFCEDIDWLMVLGGKPSTDEGKAMISDHESECRRCARKGRWQDLIDIILIRTSEDETRAESIFGPVEWPAQP